MYISVVQKPLIMLCMVQTLENTCINVVLHGLYSFSNCKFAMQHFKPLSP